MNRLISWGAEWPFVLSLVVMLVCAIWLMLIFWKKESEYLFSPRSECPQEYLFKHRIFNSVKWLAISAAVSTTFLKF